MHLPWRPVRQGWALACVPSIRCAASLAGAFAGLNFPGALGQHGPGMDVPAEWILLAGTVLAGAVARLYHRQTKSEDRCEQAREAMAKEMASLRAAHAKELAEFTRINAKIATEQLATNNRLATVLTDVGGVLYQSIKTLRRYEPHPTPVPGSDQALVVTRSGDTSEFFEQEISQTPKSGTAAKDYDHG